MSITAEAAGRDNVRLQLTEGPVEITVVMEHAELKRFWSTLGRVLEETDPT